MPPQAQVSREDGFAAVQTFAVDDIAKSLPELLHSFLEPLDEMFDFFELPKSLVVEELRKMRREPL
ncbi:MAG: hypothetical protein ACKVPX_10015 [Myxococcaceae bacterium]